MFKAHGSTLLWMQFVSKFCNPSGNTCFFQAKHKQTKSKNCLFFFLQKKTIGNFYTIVFIRSDAGHCLSLECCKTLFLVLEVESMVFHLLNT